MSSDTIHDDSPRSPESSASNYDGSSSEDGELAQSDADNQYPATGDNTPNVRARRHAVRLNQRRRRRRNLPNRPIHNRYNHGFERRRRQVTHFRERGPRNGQMRRSSEFGDTIIPRMLFCESKRAYHNNLMISRSDFISRCRRLSSISYQHRGSPDLFHILWNELRDGADVHCLLCVCNYNFCKDFLRGSFSDITNSA
jgi:hypothetical protein